MKNIIAAFGVCLLVLALTGSNALAQCGGCGISNYSSSYPQKSGGAPYGFIKAPAYGGSYCGGGQSYAGNRPGQASTLPPCCQTGQTAPSTAYKGYERGQTPSQSTLPPCCQTGQGPSPTSAYTPRGPIRREVVQVNYSGARTAIARPAARQKVARPEAPRLPSYGTGPGQTAAEFTRQATGSRPTRSLWALLDGSNGRRRTTVVQQASAKPSEKSSVTKLLSWNPQWARPASAPGRVALNQPTKPSSSNLPPCCAAQTQQ